MMSAEKRTKVRKIVKKLNRYRIVEPRAFSEKIGSGCSLVEPLRSPFDGNWSVMAQTTQGHYGSIEFGRGGLYSTSGYYVGGLPGAVGRHVCPSGYVHVNAVAGPRTAYAAGRLWRLQRDLGRSRAVRCLLRCLERRSLLVMEVWQRKVGGSVNHSSPMRLNIRRLSGGTQLMVRS